MHITYLKKCLALAKKGRGNAAPNPMVGAILVHTKKIIGEGFHAKYGSAHAEVEAINNAIENGNAELIKEATLYVSLEPCCHTGKTPPCTEAILKNGIKHVIIGMRDPNPMVSGGGIEILTKLGVKVVVIEIPEAVELNKVFIKNITTHLPYVHVKVATTADGKLTVMAGKRTKLTTKEQDVQVHRLRATYDAIMVGRKTVEIDNPKLTCRLNELTDGSESGKNPIRIILDSQLSITPNLQIFKQSGKNIIATLKDSRKQNNSSDYQAEVILCKSDENSRIDLNDLFEKLYKHGIHSILVEGGYETITSLKKAHLIDEFSVFKSNIISVDPTLPTIVLP